MSSPKDICLLRNVEYILQKLKTCPIIFVDNCTNYLTYMWLDARDSTCDPFTRTNANSWLVEASSVKNLFLSKCSWSWFTNLHFIGKTIFLSCWKAVQHIQKHIWIEIIRSKNVLVQNFIHRGHLFFVPIHFCSTSSSLY